MKKNIAEYEWTFREIIRQHSPDISDEALEAFEGALTEWKCRKGQAFVEQDEFCNKWFFVSKGLHRVMHSRKDKTDTLFMDGGGAVFTSFHTFMVGKRGIFRVEALTDCFGWEIQHYRYKELVEEFPELLKFEVNLLRAQMWGLEISYMRRALATPQERYNQFWHDWPAAFQLDSHLAQNLMKYIPLKVIAQYLSMTQQTLSVLRRREMDKLRRQKGKKDDG